MKKPLGLDFRLLPKALKQYYTLWSTSLVIYRRGFCQVLYSGLLVVRLNALTSQFTFQVMNYYFEHIFFIKSLFE